jgi:hypothetical protein
MKWQVPSTPVCNTAQLDHHLKVETCSQADDKYVRMQMAYFHTKYRILSHDTSILTGAKRVE